MTKIRLARFGSRHQPHYRIVVTDSRNPRDGRFIEILGFFDPQTEKLELNAERAEYWLSVGAQPTNTTISLLTKGGAKHNFKPRRKPFRAVEKPEEDKTEEASETATEKADETAPEAPAEEAVATEEAK